MKGPWEILNSKPQVLPQTKPGWSREAQVTENRDCTETGEQGPGRSSATGPGLHHSSDQSTHCIELSEKEGGDISLQLEGSALINLVP